MIKHRVIALNTNPQDLTWGGIIDPINTLSIQNISDTGYAYLGSESVTTTNFGYRLHPGQSFIIQLAPADKVYAVTDGNVSVAIFELDF